MKRKFAISWISEVSDGGGDIGGYVHFSDGRGKVNLMALDFEFYRSGKLKGNIKLTA
jgi:hypothetical protein